MSTGTAIAVALTFVWLGMVLAISFLEAPLKFRAPNVTLQIGLGIGRLVFRALNTVEVVFALVIGAIVVAGPTRAGVAVAIGVADPPVRPGAGRGRRTPLPGPLRLRRAGGGQGGRADRGGDTATERLTANPQGEGLATSKDPIMDSVSLTDLAAEKLAEAKQSHSGRAAHTIHGGHTHELRQTVLALLADHDLSEHDSPGEATLQVLQGHVRLTTGGDAWEGRAGEYVAIPAERHALHAVEDSVVLLTVLKTIPSAH